METLWEGSRLGLGIWENLPRVALAAGHPAPPVDFSGTFSPNAPTPPSVHGPRNHRPDPVTFCLVPGTSRSILGKIPVPVPIGGLAPPLYALPARDVCLFKRTAMPWSKGTDFRISRPMGLDSLGPGVPGRPTDRAL